MKVTNLLNHSILKRSLIIVLLGLATGCASLEPPAKPSIAADMQSPAEIMSQKMAAIKKAHRKTLPPLTTLKPKVAVEKKMPYEDQLFSVVARSTPVRDVLLGLAKEADINLIIDKGADPSEQISVEMHDLPLRKILDTVLEAYEFFYVLEENILRVKSFQTRMFHFDYPLMSNTPSSSIGGDLLGGGGDESSSNLTGEFSVEAEIDKEDLNVWEQIKNTIKGDDEDSGDEEEATGLMSAQGKLQMNKMSGTIVVTDRKANLDTIAEYLNTVQRSLDRQVILEAKILEVELNNDHQYGINWSNLTLGNFLGEAVATIGADLSAGTAGLNFNIVKNTGTNTLDATINALSSQGDVNVLSSPRLNVINNQTALINVGRTIPYLDWTLSVESIEGEVVTSSVVPQVKTAQSGITLGVTPQINAAGVTTLHIVPVITSIVSTEQFTFDGTTWDVPIFDVRQTDTMVKVRDGETIILGGLIQNKYTDTRNKIPMLGDIPLLGNVLFAGDVVESDKLELVILLTPTIVEK